MPNFKQITITIVLGFILLAVLQNFYDINQDPFPELTESIKESEAGNQELDRLIREAKD